MHTTEPLEMKWLLPPFGRLEKSHLLRCSRCTPNLDTKTQWKKQPEPTTSSGGRLCWQNLQTLPTSEDLRITHPTSPRGRPARCCWPGSKLGLLKVTVPATCASCWWRAPTSSSTRRPRRSSSWSRSKPTAQAMLAPGRASAETPPAPLRSRRTTPRRAV